MANFDEDDFSEEAPESEDGDLEEFGDSDDL